MKRVGIAIFVSIFLSFSGALAGAATLNWKFDTGGPVYSKPAIAADGTVYFGSGDNYLYAFWPNGTMKWSYETGDVIWTNPAIASDETVYSNSEDNYLYAFWPNGTMKWNYYIEGWLSAVIGPNQNIYIPGYNDSGDDFMFAVYPNGTEYWRFHPDDPIMSDPATDSNDNIYFGTNETLYSLYPNGTFRWKFFTGNQIWSPPVIKSDGMVYFSGYTTETPPIVENYLYSIHPNGTEQWRFETWNFIPESGPALGPDGTIYQCVEWLGINAFYPNGTFKWRFISSPVQWCLVVPEVGPDGTIYAGFSDNRTYAVYPNGTLRWKYDLNNDLYNFWPLFHAPAVSADNTVYIGSYSGSLYSIIETSLPGSAVCGDDICGPDENSTDCCIDCGCPMYSHCESNECILTCYDLTCAPGENSTTCCYDCGCDPGYNCEKPGSVYECVSKCGDSECNYGENSTICCEDCGCDQGFSCVDGACEVVCGDSMCNPESEDCSDCPADCLGDGQVCCSGVAYTGDCCSDSDCQLGYSCSSNVCTAPPPPPPTSPPSSYCGDGTCNSVESCLTCPQDCVCGPGTYCCGGVCETPNCSSDSDCSDAEPCTVDVCVGVGCNSSCSNIGITDCQNNDSCCPIGCGPLDDADCICADECEQGDYKCESNITYDCIKSGTDCSSWFENHTCPLGCCDDICCTNVSDEIPSPFETLSLPNVLPVVWIVMGISAVILVIYFLFIRI